LEVPEDVVPKKRQRNVAKCERTRIHNLNRQQYKYADIVLPKLQQINTKSRTWYSQRVKTDAEIFVVYCEVGVVHIRQTGTDERARNEDVQVEGDSRVSKRRKQPALTLERAAVAPENTPLSPIILSKGKARFATLVGWIVQELT
jgi:hypothetical protein